MCLSYISTRTWHVVSYGVAIRIVVRLLRKRSTYGALCVLCGSLAGCMCPVRRPGPAGSAHSSIYFSRGLQRRTGPQRMAVGSRGTSQVPGIEVSRNSPVVQGLPAGAHAPPTRERPVSRCLRRASLRAGVVGVLERGEEDAVDAKGPRPPEAPRRRPLAAGTSALVSEVYAQPRATTGVCMHYEVQLTVRHACLCMSMTYTQVLMYICTDIEEHSGT